MDLSGLSVVSLNWYTLICVLVLVVILAAGYFYNRSLQKTLGSTADLMKGWQAFAEANNLKFNPRLNGEITGDYKGYPISATAIPIREPRRGEPTDPKQLFATMLILTLSIPTKGAFQLVPAGPERPVEGRVITSDLLFDSRFTLTSQPLALANCFITQKELRQKLCQIEAPFTLKNDNSALIYHQPGLAAEASGLQFLLDLMVELAENIQPV